MTTSIRSQYNHTKKKWQVAKQTPKGSWEVISNMMHDSEQAANAMVNWYIESFPSEYIKHQPTTKQS